MAPSFLLVDTSIGKELTQKMSGNFPIHAKNIEKQPLNRRKTQNMKKIALKPVDMQFLFSYNV